MAPGISCACAALQVALCIVANAMLPSRDLQASGVQMLRARAALEVQLRNHLPACALEQLAHQLGAWPRQPMLT
jgi:hypothetical protein